MNISNTMDNINQPFLYGRPLLHSTMLLNKTELVFLIFHQPHVDACALGKNESASLTRTAIICVTDMVELFLQDKRSRVNGTPFCFIPLSISCMDSNTVCKCSAERHWC